MELTTKTLLKYRTEKDICPFDKWLSTLPLKEQAIIEARLDRVALGNFGDRKYLCNEIFELRIHYRSGLRIYYTPFEERGILLLTGGKKNSQKQDIKKAEKFLKDLKVEINRNAH